MSWLQRAASWLHSVRRSPSGSFPRGPDRVQIDDRRLRFEPLEPRLLLSASSLPLEIMPFVEGVGWQVSEDAYLAPASLAEPEAGVAAATAAGESVASSPPGQIPYGATFTDGSEYMLGDVWVSLVLFESNGAIDPNTENWDSTRIGQVKSEVTEGLQWWDDTLSVQYPASPAELLHFGVDFSCADQPVPTSYEPITHPHTDHGLWINDFLNQVGYNSSADYLTDLESWNNAQRLAHEADWAFTIFVVDSYVDDNGMFSNGRFGYAYLGGPFTGMTYDNDGWGISMMGQVLAHETGHIFFALDEYPGSGGKYTDHSGYYNTQNLNASDGQPPGGVRVDSLMAEASLQNAAYAAHTSSPTSLQMLGWKDSDGGKVFDVLDVPLTLAGSGAYDPLRARYVFSGSSSVQTLDNLNPYGAHHDITINTVDRLQYRIDGGLWINGSATYHAYSTSVSQVVDVAGLTDAEHTIEFRTIADLTGVTSNIITDSFSVVPGNRPPVASGESYSVDEDGTLGVGASGVLANDTDPDVGDLLAAFLDTGPAHGILTLNSDGSFTYKPNADFHGLDQFDYLVSDGKGGVDVATATITVTSVADIRVTAGAGVVEGNSGTTPFTFTVSLDDAEEAPVTGNWAVAGTGPDPADAADFQGGLPSGTVTFPAGTTTLAETVTIYILGDTLAEGDEGFTVTLSNASANASIAAGSATAHILNDDTPFVYEYRDTAQAESPVYGTVAGSVADTRTADGAVETITEVLYQSNRRAHLEHVWRFDVTGGDLGVSFHVTGRTSGEAILFEYDIQDGTGWHALVTMTDTLLRPYSVDLPTSLRGVVLVRARDAVSRETFRDTLTIDEMYFLSQRLSPLPPRVSIRATDPSASEAGPDQGQFLVELVGGTVQASDLTVYYETAGSSARASDYEETLSGSVVIPAGASSASISITPVDDAVEEMSETVMLTLLDDPAYDLGAPATAKVSIADNDVAFAQSEQTIYGTVSGGYTYTATRVADETCERLTEQLYAGSKKSRLEHRWTFDTTGFTNAMFVLIAQRLTPGDPDTFRFQMSVNGGATWTDLVTVTSTDLTKQEFDVSLPGGPVLVRVIDTDASNDRSAAQIAIDYMAFRAVSSGTGTMPSSGGWWQGLIEAWWKQKMMW